MQELAGVVHSPAGAARGRPNDPGADPTQRWRTRRRPSASIDPLK
ncbi:MAG: hypothetical protein ACXW15_01280 [Acidimicrobiia bacterium]